MASAKCSEDLENILPERHKSLQMPLAPLPITKVRFEQIPSGVQTFYLVTNQLTNSPSEPAKQNKGDKNF